MAGKEIQNLTPKKDLIPLALILNELTPGVPAGAVVTTVPLSVAAGLLCISEYALLEGAAAGEFTVETDTPGGVLELTPDELKSSLKYRVVLVTQKRLSEARKGLHPNFSISISSSIVTKETVKIPFKDLHFRYAEILKKIKDRESVKSPFKATQSKGSQRKRSPREEQKKATRLRDEAIRECAEELLESESCEVFLWATNKPKKEKLAAHICKYPSRFSKLSGMAISLSIAKKALNNFKRPKGS